MRIFYAQQLCSATTRDGETCPAASGSHRFPYERITTWLKRVFGIDMQRCPNCGGGERQIIAAILQRPVVEKILTHLGLGPQPPPRGRARETGQD